MAHLSFAASSRCPTVRQQRPRRSRVTITPFAQQSVRHDLNVLNSPVASAATGRRQALLGALVGGVALSGWASAPSAVLAKAKEEKQPTVINDPVVLKSQLQAQYEQWGAGQFDAWLAGQPETIKWQSTYNGGPLKLKGKAGAQQYWTLLNADLAITSYKPLAIFVDNDGDEATVVVEAVGTSKRTQQPFSTILLHMYTIGPMAQIIKFKEVTDTAVFAQLAPPAQAPAGAAAVVSSPPAASEGEVAVEPGPAARSI